jgi:ubiquinone/menaquinone biosynthesis C-methylase UbiE
VLETVGVAENCVVLDFGCGPGTYAIPAARLVGVGGKVYALDKDASALNRIERTVHRERVRNLETILSSDLRTGLPAGGVDVVLLHDVVHMIKDRSALYRELHRVLGPGGQVSVYPMHVDKDQVAIQMHESGFSLQAEEYEGHILLFQKAKQAPAGSA